MSRRGWTKRHGMLLVALGVLVAPPLSGRTFTNTAGKSIEAEIVRATNTEVTLRLKNRRKATVPLNTLSKEDQDFVAAWLADEVPPLRFTPKMVKSNRDHRYSNSSSSSRQIQTYEMSVEVQNDQNALGLEESVMQFVLVGRSLRDSSSYKILMVQKVPFKVAPAGRAVIPFRKVVNK